MKIKEKFFRHPVVYPMLISEIVGLILCLGVFLINSAEYREGIESLIKGIPEVIIISFFLSIFFIYPFMLTISNLIFLFKKHKSAEDILNGKIIEIITIILGILFSMLLIGVNNIKLDADWTERLSNAEIHTPIATWTMPTIITLAIVALAGYCILRFVPLEKQPPLVTVCAMGSMYIGILECIIWSIQIFHIDNFMLCILPINWIIIVTKVIRDIINQYNEKEMKECSEEKYSENNFMQRCNRMLLKSQSWPLIAFIIMWPIFGIIVIVLTLFGQSPDNFIKAWIETSDWNLSQRVAPKNVMYDGHYLCTVAAGGHKKVVKPLRLGVRHGHEVIVNRQLCIANAFEQIMEEKIPKIHRLIRNFYDTYGYPVARLIKSQYTADLIYFIMKPLEWFFLIVIYFCDTNPENRIAVQYMPKNREKMIF